MRPEAEAKDGHFQSVQTVQWFPEDSALFVTSGMDQRLLVWDANSLKIAEEFKINKLVFCHHLSRPPSTMVAVGSSSNHLRLIDLKSGSSTHELRGHSGTDSIKWNKLGVRFTNFKTLLTKLRQCNQTRSPNQF